MEHTKVMKTKWTSGPWKAETIKQLGVKKWHQVVTTGKVGICVVSDVDRQPAEANARLIAAAPDLLEALQGIMEIIPDDCECDNTHENNNTICRFCWARKAIEKAKGI